MLSLQDRGEPKGISVNLFCIRNNILYTVTHQCFKKTQKKIVSTESESIPEQIVQDSNERQEVSKVKHKHTFFIKEASWQR